jgi:hypothetical protein
MRNGSKVIHFNFFLVSLFEIRISTIEIEKKTQKKIIKKKKKKINKKKKKKFN